MNGIATVYFAAAAYLLTGSDYCHSTDLSEEGPVVRVNQKPKIAIICSRDYRSIE